MTPISDRAAPRFGRPDLPSWRAGSVSPRNEASDPSHAEGLSVPLAGELQGAHGPRSPNRWQRRALLRLPADQYPADPDAEETATNRRDEDRDEC